MYGDAFVRRHVSTRELPAMLAQYGITWTLLTPWNPHLVALDRMPGWRRLYADDRAVVHVRDAQN
jgi:hypothetical protein